jgi:hypothetical protein
MPICAARSEWPGVDSSACSCAAARSCVIFSLDFFDEPLNSFFSFSSTAGWYQAEIGSCLNPRPHEPRAVSDTVYRSITSSRCATIAFTTSSGTGSSALKRNVPLVPSVASTAPTVGYTLM